MRWQSTPGRPLERQDQGTGTWSGTAGAGEDFSSRSIRLDVVFAAHRCRLIARGQPKRNLESPQLLGGRDMMRKCMVMSLSVMVCTFSTMSSVAALPAREAQADPAAAGPLDCESGAISPVPKTGQTLCVDQPGGMFIECAGTGEDGDLQKGVSAAPRFTANGDGTVRDNLTGLIWLQNADCFGARQLTDAQRDVRTLANGACGLTDGSVAGAWRLPNVRELLSLVDYGQHWPALVVGHPFTDVLASGEFYWSSSRYVAGNFTIPWWTVSLAGGFGFPPVNDSAAVWPVRGGCDFTLDLAGPGIAAGPYQSAPGDINGPCDPACDPAVISPVPKTEGTACSDSLSVVPIDCQGERWARTLQVGVSVSPRFTANGDGTVTDNLTGLIWLQNAGCFGYREWVDALTDAATLSSGACGLTDGSRPGDWRLPNIRELLSLIDYGRSGPALPPEHPFTAVGAIYQSSSLYLPTAYFPWVVSLNFGLSGDGGPGEVWPVRDGP